MFAVLYVARNIPMWSRAGTSARSRRLVGSYVRLEESSGQYRAEFKEYPNTSTGKTGFPTLRFDGTCACDHQCL